MQTVTFDQLDQSQQKLLEAANEAKENAYNPYSNFYVGAALLSLNNEIITGSNVENAAYGSTICAERSALLNANDKGIRQFKKIAIIARGNNFDTTEVTSPCGACRQMIFEAAQLSDTNIEIIMANTKMNKIIISTIKELLPLAFGPQDLNIDMEKWT